MSDLEETIATYLALDGQVFIAPQYNIAYDKNLNEGGSVPDFVALDFKTRHIIVVEVSMAANMDPLMKRIYARESRWYSPIRRVLDKTLVVDKSWPIRFIGFIRGANCIKMEAVYAADRDVAFKAIEDATHLWKYWDDRIKYGLPGAVMARCK